MPTVVAPGIGINFEVSAAPGPDGGLVFVIKPAVNAANQEMADADGLRIPVNAVIRDPSGQEVNIGDAALNAGRVVLAGGANIASFFIDSALYARGVDGGVPVLFATGNPPIVPSGRAAVARMSDDGLIYVLGPPRANSVDTVAPLSLTTTAETLMLPGAASTFHDLCHLTITSDYTAQQDPSIKVHLRDTTGGAIRWTVAVAEKGGGDIKFPKNKKQLTANIGGNWTAQLSAAPPAGRTIFVNAEAEKRLS